MFNENYSFIVNFLINSKLMFYFYAKYPIVLEKSLVIGFIVIAIWSTMLNGMIFGKIGDYGHNHFPKWLQKIVFDCPICQTPYYGTALYWLIYHHSIKEWLIVVIAAMGFVTIFVKMKRF